MSEIEEKAKEKLKDYPSEYLHAMNGKLSLDVPLDCFTFAQGNAGTGSTFDGNIEAFRRYRLIPRMMVDTNVRNLEVNP